MIVFLHYILCQVHDFDYDRKVDISHPGFYRLEIIIIHHIAKISVDPAVDQVYHCVRDIRFLRLIHGAFDRADDHFHLVLFFVYALGNIIEKPGVDIFSVNHRAEFLPAAVSHSSEDFLHDQQFILKIGTCLLL